MYKKIIILLIITTSVLFFSGCSIGKYSGLTAEEWANQTNSCEYKLNNYKTALDEANDNIKDAQSYVGESYEDMEWALLNLSSVAEPY